MTPYPSQEDKAAHERRVFSIFAAYAAEHSQFAVESNTIESRKPPEPDILCRVTNHGFVAFELLEILDSSARKWMATMEQARDALLQYPQRLSAADQAELS